MNILDLSALYLHFISVLIEDEALRRLQPDATYYVGFDAFRKENPKYHHEFYYPFDARSAVTPQINNISLVVSIKIYKHIKNKSSILWKWSKYFQNYIMLPLHLATASNISSSVSRCR